MLPSLEIHREGHSAIEVPPQGALVGRDPACDIVFDIPSVGRRHARFEPRKDGWYLVDLGSANGTFVEGKPVTTTPVRAGQRVAFGRCLVLLAESSVPPRTRVVDLDVPATTVMDLNELLAEPLVPPPAPEPPPQAEPPPEAELPLESEPATAWEMLGISGPADFVAIHAAYSEKARDTSARIAAAHTPALRATYQRRLGELRQAYEQLVAAARDTDLPSAEPVVTADAAPSVLLAESYEVARPGVEPIPIIGQILGFAAILLVGLAVHFMYRPRSEKDAWQREREDAKIGEAAARAQHDAQAPTKALLEGAAFDSQQVRFCNSGPDTVTLLWVGAQWAEIKRPDTISIVAAADALELEPITVQFHSFNSDYCQDAFKLGGTVHKPSDGPRGMELGIPLGPGEHSFPAIVSDVKGCRWDGKAFFVAVQARSATGREFRVSKLLTAESNCVSLTPASPGGGEKGELELP